MEQYTVRSRHCHLCLPPTPKMEGAPTPVSLPATLDHARIRSLPTAAYYITNFITEEEEAAILKKVGGSLLQVPPCLTLQISTAPKPRWKQLTHRRLQTWPSDLVKNTLLDAPLPAWLSEPVVERLLSIPVSGSESSPNLFSSSPHRQPNHVLINEYPPGVGIMPHKVGRGEPALRGPEWLILAVGRVRLSPGGLHCEPGRQPLPEHPQEQRGWNGRADAGLEDSAGAKVPSRHHPRSVHGIPPRHCRHQTRRRLVRGHCGQLEPPAFPGQL